MSCRINEGMSKNVQQKSIDWDDTIKKEARGKNDEDLGEVNGIGRTYVMTQKGMFDKEKFYIPKYLVEGYDGNIVRFKVTEEEARNSFLRDTEPTSDEYSRYKTANTPTDIETRIPVIEERLDIAKRQYAQEATITKEPVTETKTVEVPLTHEEVTVERRSPSGRATTETPVESATKVRVPLKHEEVEVTKKPYVKEEVVVKKKPVTEKRQVSEQVRGERVKTSTGVQEEEQD
jgi:uncharacterized protein (TIGR02271 family)